MAPRRRAIQREKIVQSQGEKLFMSLGAQVYRFGTRRAQRCWNCHEISKDQGTRQTPGPADIQAFLPPPRYPVDESVRHVFAHPRRRYQVMWEAKRDPHQKLSDDQAVFAAMCHDADVLHVYGDLSALFAFFILHGWLKADNVPHYRRPETSHV